MRELAAAGLSLIKSFEDCRLTAYKPFPTEKYWTIGWGHYGPDVKQGQTITQEQADAMLVDDLKRYIAYVNNNNFVTIIDNLNQNQFDALVSFCYNCGPGNLQDLCKGKRTPEAIAEDLPKYNKGGGKVLAGLVRRRAAELELFNKEDDEDMAKIEELQKQIAELQANQATHLKTLEAHVERIVALEDKANVTEIPEWAKAAIDKAVAKGIINTPNGGSYDFYRLVTVLNNAGLI